MICEHAFAFMYVMFVRPGFCEILVLSDLINIAGLKFAKENGNVYS